MSLYLTTELKDSKYQLVISNHVHVVSPSPGCDLGALFSASHDRVWESRHVPIIYVIICMYICTICMYNVDGRV